MSHATLTVAFVLPMSATASPIVLNEVLYDPPGSDGGFELVELGAAAGADENASLDGWVLETGNGASPGSWTVEWVGGPADRLRDGLFVVGESAVEPSPDAVTDLDLQNGPDACRLRGPGGEVDVLGWGEPLAIGLYEGRPAEDVSGRSLARAPDGFDTGDNSLDFLPAEPSPGAFNSPDRALAVESLTVDPADPAIGQAVAFTWAVRNVGRRTFDGSLLLRCDVHPDEALGRVEVTGLAPGERRTLARTLAPPQGAHLPRSDPPAPEAPAPWRGEGEDLRFSEALTRPAPDGAEWVELTSIAGRPVGLGAFRLADAAGTAGALAGRVESGELVVLVADSLAFREAWSVPAGTPIVTVRPWPSLNHTASSGEVAERLALVLGELEVAVAALPGGADEAVAWETISGDHPPGDLASWAPSLDASGGTPGRANSRRGDRPAPAVAAGTLAAHPSPFRPARDGTVLLVLRSAVPVARCEMTVFDSTGRLVRRLVPWSASAGEHRALWDGRHGSGAPAALGLYVVRAEGAELPAAHATLVLVP